MIRHCAALQKLIFTNHVQYNVLQKPTIFLPQQGSVHNNAEFYLTILKFIQTWGGREKNK